MIHIHIHMIYTSIGMDPDLECVTLWRDRDYLNKFEGRQDLLDYAAAEGIPGTLSFVSGRICRTTVNYMI